MAKGLGVSISMHKLSLRSPALLSCILSFALARNAFAQPATPPAAAAAAPPAAPAPAATDKSAAAPAAGDDASELGRLRAEVEDTKKQVAELKAAQEEAAAAASPSDEPVAEQEKLKI